MNRYEVTVSNFIGHEQKILGMYTEHAGNPRVAMMRVMQYRLDFPKYIAQGGVSMISLKFDVTNRGKVIRIAEARWDDCPEYIVTIDGIRYNTQDDDDKCQVERKFYGYRHEFVLKSEPIPEGWEVYRQNAPYQYRFKSGADATKLKNEFKLIDWGKEANYLPR